MLYWNFYAMFYCLFLNVFRQASGSFSAGLVVEHTGLSRIWMCGLRLDTRNCEILHFEFSDIALNSQILHFQLSRDFWDNMAASYARGHYFTIYWTMQRVKPVSISVKLFEHM